MIKKKKLISKNYNWLINIEYKFSLVCFFSDNVHEWMNLKKTVWRLSEREREGSQRSKNSNNF